MNLLSVLYPILIPFYIFLHRIAALWGHSKAKKMLQGRNQLKTFLGDNIPSHNPSLLIHCASLGEYEMAIPVINFLRTEFPHHQIIVSFYSPSGYENAKLPAFIHPSTTANTPVVKTYLPWDNLGDLDTFLTWINPQFVFIIRYELWYNFIRTLNQKSIPFAVLGMNIHENHFLGKRWAQPWRKALKEVAGIGVLNQTMVATATDWGMPKERIFVWGDSKFNRAMERFNAFSQDTSPANATDPSNPNSTGSKSVSTHLPETLTHWLANKNTLILGSSWEAEESLLLNYLNLHPLPQNWQILIAPHDISTAHCQNLLNQFQQFLPELATSLPNNPSASSNPSTVSQPPILILNSIGQLANCYRFGKIAIIGGAFGKGLHNMAEASVFGMPLLFGPKHQKFPEAQQAINAGFAFQIIDQSAFNLKLSQLIQNQSLREKLGSIAHSFAANNQVQLQSLWQIPELVNLAERN